jgi:diguanylate cyclase (GGDEF)-like protein/PAS domain S-box-containing protein
MKIKSTDQKFINANSLASQSFEKIISLVGTTAKLNAMMKALPDIIFLYDEDGIHLEVIANDESNLITAKENFIGCRIDDFHSNTINDKFKKLIKDTISSNELNIIEYELSINDEEKSYEARGIPVDYELNKKKVVMIIVRDITKRKVAEENLQYIATHDSLTNLPNRTLLYDRLHRAILRAKRLDHKGALFFLDLNRFKDINDSLGHEMGDKLLIKVTKRLQSILREDDTLARLGGDEFVLIAENIKHKDDAAKIAEKILSIFKKPFNTQNYNLSVGTSIGVTLFPDNADTVTKLVKQADMAMYYSKEKSIGYKFFESELIQKALMHFKLEHALKDAIKNDELYIEYQPQVTISKNKVIGLEALLRWENKEFGLVSPHKFIRIAEQSGLINKIGEWVIDEVCKQVQEWGEIGDKLVMGINLSRVQLSNPILHKQIKKILSKYAFDNSCIEFEITESAVFDNPKIAQENIKKIKELGCLISIDDFGTGFSSLSNLKSFKLDKIKIDKSFVDDIEKENGNEAIVKATIALAKSLGLKVIAEGVETQNQLDFLEKENCDEIQGFLFSKPLPVDDVTKLIDN